MNKPIVRVPARRTPAAGMTVGEAGAVATAFGRYVVGGYTGARSDKSSMQNWRTLAASADNDTLGDLDTLRARSRDLGRNNPLAVGALATETTNVVGTGLWPCAAVNAEILGISEDEATAIGRRAELLWNVFADSTLCDITRATNFAGLQEIVFRAVLESGDILVVRRQKPRRGAIVGLALQLVEADRIRTPSTVPETDRLAAGVETDGDGDGEPVRFHIASGYSGTFLNLIGGPEDFTTVDAFGSVSGQPLALLVRRKLRDGQRRGVPFLAAVIEPLKQLDRYTESELMAAVVSSFFTVFVKSATGGNLGQMEAGSGPMGGDGMAAPGDIALGPGAVVELGRDEDVTFANPNRPSPQFDPFWLAMVKQIGVALEIPFELLIKHFSSSYSASRAALETAWQHFKARRAWLASAFCQPVYEWFFAECVARGLIDAPGFFEDPLKRAAWSAATWVGDARISLDQVKDAKADKLMQDEGWKTAEEITAERTGGDWWAKLPKRQREVEARRKAGLEVLPVAPGAPGSPPGAPSALLGHNGGPALEDPDEGPGEGDDP